MKREHDRQERELRQRQRDELHRQAAGGQASKGGKHVARQFSNTACRNVLMDATRRMVGRVANHGGQFDRALKSPAAFTEWLEGLEEKHMDVFGVTFSAIERPGVAAWLMDSLSREFGALADTCTVAALPVAAKRLVGELSERLPQEAVAVYLGE